MDGEWVPVVVVNRRYLNFLNRRVGDGESYPIPYPSVRVDLPNRRFYLLDDSNSMMRGLGHASLLAPLEFCGAHAFLI